MYQHVPAKQWAVSLPPATLSLLEAEARLRNVPLRDWIAWLVDEYFRREGGLLDE